MRTWAVLKKVKFRICFQNKHTQFTLSPFESKRLIWTQNPKVIYHNIFSKKILFPFFFSLPNFSGGQKQRVGLPRVCYFRKQKDETGCWRPDYSCLHNLTSSKFSEEEVSSVIPIFVSQAENRVRGLSQYTLFPFVKGLPFQSMKLF